jgi:translocon-associated protein subunit beta
MDIVVKYNLFNVGDNAATNVQVADSGFRQEDFDVVAGQTKYRLDRVAPGANASHTVVVRPKKFGYFNFTAAEVTYNAGESGVILTGLSSDPGQGVIIAARDYERQFSAHMVRTDAALALT